MYDNLDLTVLELTDDEVKVMRDALERLIGKNSKIAHGDADLKSVLYLLEEAFKTTEDYRIAEDESYVRMSIKDKAAFKEFMVTPATDLVS